MAKHPCSTGSPTSTLVILNPKAGDYSLQVTEVIERFFGPRQWSYEIFETTDSKQDTIKKVGEAFCPGPSPAWCDARYRTRIKWLVELDS